MKFCIYILKELSSGINTNCICKNEKERIEKLNEKIKLLDIREVYSNIPTIQSEKRLRSFQLACNICTQLESKLQLCETINQLPTYVYGNILIVWDSMEMQLILNKYGMIGKFIWIDELNGCLIVNNHGWMFDNAFIKERQCLFF
jgi:hypothetical protein